MSNIVRSPNLRDGDTAIVVRIYERPEPLRFSEGGLAQAAQAVQGAGRAGDDILLHVNAEEFAQLQEAWGEPSINPETGLPEYGFFSKLWKKIKKIAKVVLPIALNFIPGVGPALAAVTKGISGALSLGAAGTAIVGKVVQGAASGALSGGGKGALAGALTGGLSGVAGKVGSKVLSGVGLNTTNKALQNVVGQGLVGGAASSLTGGKFADGLKSGALGAALTPIAQNALADTKFGSKYGINPSKEPSLLNPGGGTSPDGLDFYTPTSRPPMTVNSDYTVGAPGTSGGGQSNLMQLASKYALPAMLLSSATGKAPADPGAPPLPPEFTEQLPVYDFDRSRTQDDENDYYSYGAGPERSFYNQNTVPTPPPVQAARGQLVRGPGTGRSDDIPAQLSDGEYVMDAETVALLGDGSIDAGARKLDEMRKRLRAHKGKKLSQGEFSDAAGEPEEYFAEGGKVGALRRSIKGRNVDRLFEVHFTRPDSRTDGVHLVKASSRAEALKVARRNHSDTRIHTATEIQPGYPDEITHQDYVAAGKKLGPGESIGSYEEGT